MNRKRTVLITGGTVRLGRAIAAVLAGCGWHVATSSHRHDAGAELTADLSQSGACEALFAATCRHFGAPPAAIVNNAALYRGDSAAVRSVDYTAPLKLAELLAASGGGTVVDILDARFAGTAAPEVPQDGTYAQCKRELAQKLAERARRLAARGVRLNAVAPGAVFAPAGMHEPAGPRIAPRPTGDDVGAAVALLLETPSIVGVMLPVDGGRHLL